MLESTPVEADPEVQRVLRRLQTVKERWYDRGRMDGRRWAIDVAAREELQWAGQEVAEQDGATLAALAHDRLRVVSERHGKQPELVPHPGPNSDALHAQRDFPRSFPVQASLERWIAEDERAGGGGPAAPPPAPEGDERPAGAAGEAGPADARTIDEPAYWSGWRDAAREIWQAVAPRLA